MFVPCLETLSCVQLCMHILQKCLSLHVKLTENQHEINSQHLLRILCVFLSSVSYNKSCHLLFCLYFLFSARNSCARNQTRALPIYMGASSNFRLITFYFPLLIFIPPTLSLQNLDSLSRDTDRLEAPSSIHFYSTLHHHHLRCIFTFQFLFISRP